MVEEKSEQEVTPCFEQMSRYLAAEVEFQLHTRHNVITMVGKLTVRNT